LLLAHRDIMWQLAVCKSGTLYISNISQGSVAEHLGVAVSYNNHFIAYLLPSLPLKQLDQYLMKL